MKPLKSFIIRVLVILFVIPIYAQVGIGTTDPKGALHVFETTGSAATPTKGTIVLEHGNNGGSSSIIFKSKSNANSDFGYINYSDNGSGDAASTEKSLFTIGVENDTPGSFVDNINIDAKGSLGINNPRPNGSASIDMGRTDRGLLMNRVALTSRGNTTPINAPAVGLMVYNTATARTDFNKVLPGFYYWDGARWNPLQKSFSVKYLQNAQVVAPATLGSYIDIPGLTQSFIAPETGKYQVIINGTYASGQLIDSQIARNFTAAPQTRTTTTNATGTTGTAHSHSVTVNPTTSVNQLQQGFGEASFQILLDGTKLGERILIANSITVLDPAGNIPTNHFALGESTQITVNVNLTAGQTYVLKVQGKEWSRANTQRGTFGVDTGGFANSASENNALRSELIINFIE